MASNRNIVVFILMSCLPKTITTKSANPVTKEVESIGEEAFNGCLGLKTLTFAGGSKLKTISSRAFSDTALTSASIPDGVVDLSGFAGSSLKTISIPASVTKINFSGCSELETVSFAAETQLTEFGYYDFTDCSSLTSIRIPASITKISWNTFAGCSSLASIEVEDGNAKYHSTGNCLIETAGKMLIRGSVSGAIPTDGSVEEIGAYAFAGYKNITSISIPWRIKIIDDGVFSGCTSLTTINYQGTKSQWNAVKKETYWKMNVGDLAVKCTDGTIHTGE